MKSTIILPKGSTLFHGTLEPLKGKLRGGGYDNILWFADTPIIAQLYIPRAGSSMIVSSDSLRLPSKDDTIQLIQAAIDLRFDLSKVTWAPGNYPDRFYDAPGWEDYDYGRERDKEIERRLEALGYHPYQGNSPGYKSYKFHVARDAHGKWQLLPQGGAAMGNLCVATTKRDMKIWAKAYGEGDLMDVQYHDIAGFRAAAKKGFDGVMIDDFAQSEEWGNFGHLSVGFFDHALPDVEITCVPATYEEYDNRRSITDGTKAWPHRSVPYFRQLLEGDAKRVTASKSNPATRYEFAGRCTDSDYKSIRSLVESAKKITRRTFSETIGPENWQQIQADLGYDRHHPISKDDWAIGYFKGIYRGKPAVFLKWSGIEHIFVAASDMTRRNGTTGTSHATTLNSSNSARKKRLMR